MKITKEFIERCKREPDRNVFMVDLSSATEQKIEKYIKKLKEKFRDRGFNNES